MRTNVATWERVLRVLVGIGLLVIGASVFQATDVFGYRAFAVAAVLLGLDFAVTGTIGFCPLYHALGWGAAPARSNVR
jgi:hypothetical protein